MSKVLGRAPMGAFWVAESPVGTIEEMFEYAEDAFETCDMVVMTALGALFIQDKGNNPVRLFDSYGAFQIALIEMPGPELVIVAVTDGQIDLSELECAISDNKEWFLKWGFKGLHSCGADINQFR